MANRSRDRAAEGKPALEMTPMIDVVFQLLIFFIVCVKHEDVLARLSADRPAHSVQETEPGHNFLDIEISRHAVLFMRHDPVVNLQNAVPSYDRLDQLLAKQARFGVDTPVTIRATADSSHGVFMRVLDFCRKHGFQNLNILTI